MPRRPDLLSRFPSADPQANRFMDRVIDLVNPLVGDVAPVTLLQRAPAGDVAEDQFTASELRASNLTPSGIAQMTVVPTTPSAFGQPGQLAADLSYLYVCVAPNLWRRVAIAAW